MAAVTLIDAVSSAAGAQSSPSRSLLFGIISLPDPANDDRGAASSSSSSSSSARDYMLVSSAHPPRPRSAVAANSDEPGNNAPTTRGGGGGTYDIHEIQAILPHSGKYASYFVGSRVVSNPALHVATRVDPLFFALAHFQRAMATGKDSDGRAATGGRLEKWQPWDQALCDLPSHVLRALNLDPDLNIGGVDDVGQLGHLLDASDMCGDDLILCKFSEERALGWLAAKFDRSVEGLRRRLREKKRRAAERSRELSSTQGGPGASVSSFTLAEDELQLKAATDNGDKKESSGGESESVLSKEEEQSVRVGALQLICEYLLTEWKNKLAKQVGMTESDWTGKKKSAKSPASPSGEECGEKRPRSSWEGAIGQEDADALLQYTTGCIGTSSSSVITPSDKQMQAQNAQSVGLKRLAKVNTKGMKSLSSFFGAGKKKKTK